jgi:hypothetical protein
MIMVLSKVELKELSVKAEAEGLTLSDLVPICERFGATPHDVLNELSVAVAEGYLQGSLPYDFCDRVMNGIINAVVEAGMTNDTPQPAFSLYQASIKVNGSALTTHRQLTPVRNTRACGRGNNAYP